MKLLRLVTQLATPPLLECTNHFQDFTENVTLNLQRSLGRYLALSVPRKLVPASLLQFLRYDGTPNSDTDFTSFKK